MFSVIVFLSICLQFQCIFCYNEFLKIHKNEMNQEIKDYVIEQALVASENETDMNNVSRKIINEMNQKYGQSWNCLTGTNTSFDGINIESKEKTFIWFSYKDRNFIVFKSFSDPLAEAQKSDAKLVIIKDGMSESMKNLTLVMVKQAIIAFSHTEYISEHMVKMLEGKYGYSWFCIIGSTGNDDKITKTFGKQAFLSLKIESLLITIFQVKNDAKDCDKQVIIRYSKNLNFSKTYR